MHDQSHQHGLLADPCLTENRAQMGAAGIAADAQALVVQFQPRCYQGAGVQGVGLAQVEDRRPKGQFPVQALQ